VSVCLRGNLSNCSQCRAHIWVWRCWNCDVWPSSGQQAWLKVPIYLSKSWTSLELCLASYSVCTFTACLLRRTLISRESTLRQSDSPHVCQIFLLSTDLTEIDLHLDFGLKKYNTCIQSPDQDQHLDRQTACLCVSVCMSTQYLWLPVCWSSSLHSQDSDMSVDWLSCPTHSSNAMCRMQLEYTIV